MKRTLACILSFVMILSTLFALPLTANAAGCDHANQDFTFVSVDSVEQGKKVEATLRCNECNNTVTAVMERDQRNISYRIVADPEELPNETTFTVGEFAQFLNSAEVKAQLNYSQSTVNEILEGLGISECGHDDYALGKAAVTGENEVTVEINCKVCSLKKGTVKVAMDGDGVHLKSTVNGFIPTRDFTVSEFLLALEDMAAAKEVTPAQKASLLKGLGFAEAVNLCDVKTSHFTLSRNGANQYIGTVHCACGSHKSAQSISISAVRNGNTASIVVRDYNNTVLFNNTVTIAELKANAYAEGRSMLNGLGTQEEIDAAVAMVLADLDADHLYPETTALPTLKKAALKKAKAAKKSAKLTWKAVKNIDGYQIQYSTDKKFKKKVKTVTVKGASKKSRTVKKLKSGKKYYFRIRTFKNVNGVVATSAWSKAKAVKVK